MRPFQHRGDFTRHHVRRGQRLTGVGQQRFVVDVRCHDKDRAGRMGAGHDQGIGFQVMVQGAIGSLVQLSGSRGHVRGSAFGFRSGG
ncbi:hypothetical protein D3C81_1707410 [compost metagenome]